MRVFLSNSFKLVQTCKRKREHLREEEVGEWTHLESG